MTTPTSGRDPVEKLAEDFADRYRRGERPSLTEYTEKYPELAKEIRELFPALVFMERFGSVDAPATGPLQTPSADTRPIPKQLGDFRILREVGRGGMGVVYEAVQESLGRHVALKVLPYQRLANAQSIERFRREARAAAKLHHTNIVPVFGVGEHDGMPYYAMQFIHGQGLETVLEEVRRLRAAQAKFPVAPFDAAPEMGVTVAQGLLTGRFATVSLDGALEADSRAPVAGVSSQSDRPGESSNGSSAGSRSFARPDAEYYRSVARIGVQLADALAYAHQQGVLHRDVKPSNLLLDTQGAVWITDFGLAKDDSNIDLTEPGDIVGTIRYMAPERFHGKSDARSDVYAAGMTLYELLTLEPAFKGYNKASLISSISRDEPPRPRKLDALIPRDLETVVLKTLAKDPAARYPSADEFADDLRRFLADRPVRARRISTGERFIRWYRRNLAVAVLTTTIAVLLVLTALGASVSAFLLGRGRENALANLRRAQSAELARTRQLAQSLLEEGRARRYSRREGQRVKALEALGESLKITRAMPAAEQRVAELRDEVIGALTQHDLYVERQWEGIVPRTTHVVFDGDLAHYARRDEAEFVSVRRVDDDRELLQLGRCRRADVFCFSPDGRYFAVTIGPGLVRIWQTEPKMLVFDGTPYKSALRGEFTADSRRFICARGDGSLLIVDLEAMRSFNRETIGKNAASPYQWFISLVPGVRWLPPVDSGCDGLACHPDGRQVAIASGTTVRVRNLDSGQITFTLTHKKRIANLAWHPRGIWLAGAYNDDRAVYVWDVTTGKRWATFEGFGNAGLMLAFSPDGELLATNAWDSRLRLWNIRTGAEVFRITSGQADLRFSRDGCRLAGYARGKTLGILRVMGGQEYRTLSAGPTEITKELEDGAVSPDGRLLAVGMPDGVRIWGLDTGLEVAYVPTGARTPGVLFLPSGDLLTGSLTGHGLQRWPIGKDAKKDTYHVGPPRTLCGGPVERLARSSDGRLVTFCPRSRGARVLDMNMPEKLSPGELRHPHGNYVAMSSSGNWIATGTFAGKNVRIWSAHAMQLEKQLYSEGDACAAFSPDERWLAMCTSSECQLYRVGSWEPGPRIPVTQFECMAFSPDSRLLAVVVEPSIIGLVDPESGRILARLEDPNQDRPHWIGFHPDGTKLLTTTNDSKSVRVWDLRRIRAKLAELGLDWDSQGAVDRDRG
ncbi:MAG TPA: serine/threonine-protein kinase [Gemmataceae bacterium]|nr:serine/threonine-protein kinase [Gemmataceae bacterium]